MKLTYHAISHRGLVRANNEDTILVGNQILRDNSDSFNFDIPEGGIVFPAIVCDGVGGNARGEEASMAACESFRSFFEELSPDTDQNELIMKLKGEMQRVNESILTEAAGCGMASTLTGLLVCGENAYVLNAGDSRVYRLRYDNLKLMTREHTMESGGRRVITNCLGMPSVTLDITPTAIVPGDIFVVCSDGLFDMVSDPEIADNANSAETLLSLALANGGYDNTSIITLRFDYLAI